MEEDLKVQPQCLIKLTNGDQIVVDVDNSEDFNGIAERIFDNTMGYFAQDKFAVRNSHVISVYYLPEGYAKSCGTAASS